MLLKRYERLSETLNEMMVDKEAWECIEMVSAMKKQTPFSHHNFFSLARDLSQPLVSYVSQWGRVEGNKVLPSTSECLTCRSKGARMRLRIE